MKFKVWAQDPNGHAAQQFSVEAPDWTAAWNKVAWHWKHENGNKPPQRIMVLIPNTVDLLEQSLA